MNAHFPKNKTRWIMEFSIIENQQKNESSFVIHEWSISVTLDDPHSITYKKISGRSPEINSIKDENSDEAYHEIKLMCPGEIKKY